MADQAAHLVDHVIPHVPMRQWVLSLPHDLRPLVAYDADLRKALLRIFLRAVFGWLRRQARRLGVRDSRCGSVTFLQRFGSESRFAPEQYPAARKGACASIFTSMRSSWTASTQWRMRAAPSSTPWPHLMLTSLRSWLG